MAIDLHKWKFHILIFICLTLCMKTNVVIDPFLKVNVAFETWQANKLLVKSFLKEWPNPQIVFALFEELYR